MIKAMEQTNQGANIAPGLLIDLNFVEQAVARSYDVTMQELHSGTRKREIVEPRQIVMFFGYRMLKMRLSKVGAHFVKDHATVSHAERKVKELYQTSKPYRNRMNEFLVQFGTDPSTFQFLKA